MPFAGPGKVSIFNELVILIATNAVDDRVLQAMPSMPVSHS